jgi:hypothetical protein
MKLSPPYGLTRFAVMPVQVIPGHRFDPKSIPHKGTQGERRSIASFVSEKAREVIVRATWPRASASWIEWTFFLEGEIWSVKGKPTSSGAPSDEAQEWDAYRVAKELMRRSGRIPRS